MEAIIVNYRRGRHTQKDNHMILEVAGVESKDAAAKLVGKSVAWVSSGKEPVTIQGKIAAAHGNSGAVRAIFEKGLPGQAISSKVKIA